MKLTEFIKVLEDCANHKHEEHDSSSLEMWDVVISKEEEGKITFNLCATLSQKERNRLRERIGLKEIEYETDKCGVW